MTLTKGTQGVRHKIDKKVARNKIKCTMQVLHFTLNNLARKGVRVRIATIGKDGNSLIREVSSLPL